MNVTEEILDQLIKRIVSEVKPLRILLFGSAAHGDLTAANDIDLLIVMPEGTHRRRTAQRLYQNIRGLGVAFDLIVATPSDLERHKNNIGLIYRQILNEGKVAYAA